MLEAEPNRRYVSRVCVRALGTGEDLVDAGGGDGTLATVLWTGRATRLLMRLLLPCMRRAVARGAVRDLYSLKRLIEETE